MGTHDETRGITEKEARRSNITRLLPEVRKQKTLITVRLFLGNSHSFLYNNL